MYKLKEMFVYFTGSIQVSASASSWLPEVCGDLWEHRLEASPSQRNVQHDILH